MSRTDLDVATIANCLRARAGDGSMEWVAGSIRASVLLDAADMLDENAKLRELCAGLLTGYECGHGELCKGCTWDGLGDPKTFPCLPRVKARELGVEVDA